MIKKLGAGVLIAVCVGALIGMVSNKVSTELSLLRTIVSLTELNNAGLKEIDARNTLLLAQEEQLAKQQASLNDCVALITTQQEEIDKAAEEINRMRLEIATKTSIINDLKKVIEELKKQTPVPDQVNPNPPVPTPVPTPTPVPDNPTPLPTPFNPPRTAQ